MYDHLTASSQADVLRSRRLDRAQQLATSYYQLQPELDALQEAMVGYFETILFVNTAVFLWCDSLLFRQGLQPREMNFQFLPAGGENSLLT